ncbi:hypothetical protein [Streptococcus sp. S784/96/1]|uniref:hypothetical protein n=1 Tax=Streptococcus sp. S784/96/1 TaxID=2653499 RepID=UPI00138A6231|nr:hypothetical protein [Streptococcus sp. S784/96/1]
MEKELREIKYSKNPIKAQQYFNMELNTGMSKSDQDIFFGYLKNVREHAKKKYGSKNIDKINHAIANAIAGVNYADDIAQKAVNDFNSDEYKKLAGYEKFVELIKKSSDNKPNATDNNYYYIDLAHFAMPIATSYQSAWYKEFLKSIMTAGNTEPRIQPDSKTIFFWLNSYTGDKLTTFGTDNKDLPTDLDAWILHSNYKNITYLDDRIKHYYGQKLNRNKELDKSFKNISPHKNIKKDTNWLDGFATFTVGALAIKTLFKGKETLSKGKEILTKIGEAEMQKAQLQAKANQHLFDLVKSFFSKLLPKKKKRKKVKRKK